MRISLHPRLIHPILCSHYLKLYALSAIFILIGMTAHAEVTYTYTGNSFATVGGNIGVTSSNHIAITFSLATPLGPDLNCASVETNGSGQLLSFNISDGVHNFGLSPDTQVFCIFTSSTGQITQWIVGNFVPGAFPFIVSTNIPSAGNENDVVAMTTVDFASVDNNPGTWSTGPGQAPPNTALQICLGTNNPGPDFCNLGDDEVEVHDTSASITNTFGSSSEQLTGSASGAAHIGILRASSSSMFSLPNSPGGHAFSHAASTFEDTVTIDFPPITGSAGTLVLTYTLNGNINSSGKGVGLGIVQGSVSGHSFAQQYLSTVSGSFVAGSFPFIYGQPFVQRFQLSTDAGTIIANSGGNSDVCAFCIGSGTASADFSNTFVLSGLEFLDSNGNPLTSPPTITSVSGTQYSVDGILTSFATLSVDEVRLNKGGERFEMRASFKLGDHSNGIDPLNEDVALQIGNFSAVIPSGAFKGQREGDDMNDLQRFTFTGTVNGLPLTIEIRALSGGAFTIKASGSQDHLIGNTGPINVRIMIGDDGGTAKALSISN